MTSHRHITVDGVDIFYREAGNPQNPTLVLLHGYPSSSFMFRDLITNLSHRFHLVAPDYPGFGNTSTPPPAEFNYTFDHLAEIIDHFLEALRLDRYSLYVQDYGGPIGFRIAAKHPERVQALIIQNANAYQEGFTPAWAPFQALWQGRNKETEATISSFYAPEVTKFFYVQGTRDPEAPNPDSWNMDQYFIDRPVNQAANMELFYDYRNNPPLYEHWHQYFRDHQPPALIVWGNGDPFFGPEGAAAFRKDLPNAEVHMLNTWHSALEEDGEAIASHIENFFTRHVSAEPFDHAGRTTNIGS